MIWLYVAGGYLTLLALIVRTAYVCERGAKSVPCSITVEHIVPRGDVIEHICGREECICGPDVRPVRRDGRWQWVATHHALMPTSSPRADA